MKIDIRAKIDLTPEIKEYIQKKMDMLEKYLGDIPVIECKVNLSLAVNGQKNGEIYRTEIIMKLPKEQLIVEKVEDDILKSIDKVKDHLSESIVKYKERMIDRHRQSA